jgi:Flp pilus assembly protein CpaB
MRSLPVIITALLVGIVGTILVLGFLGVVPIFGRGKGTAGPVAGPGQKLVPVTAYNIPAYSPVQREHLFNSRAMRFVEVPVDVDEMPKDTIYDRKQLIGRVLAHPKKAYMSFQESDFLPAGTAAGISGAIEPGKRAIVVEADRIQGVQGLRQGDRFDLLMAVPHTNRHTHSLIVDRDGVPVTSAVETVLLINNGAVIGGVTERKEEYKSQEGVLGGSVYKNRTIREISLAVEPNEVAKLTSALASGQSLIAVVRSGRPDAGASDIDIRIPSFSAAPSAAIEVPAATPAPFVVEEIRGRNRSSSSFNQ